MSPRSLYTLPTRRLTMVLRSLAWHEMRSILTAVLLNFDIELAEQPKKNWLEQKAYFVWEKPPLYIKLNPREPKASA